MYEGLKHTTEGREGGGRKREEIMMKIVTTDIVTTQPPEFQTPAISTACVKS